MTAEGRGRRVPGPSPVSRKYKGIVVLGRNEDTLSPHSYGTQGVHGQVYRGNLPGQEG